MRIVFLGTPELATPSLAAVAGRHEVTAVVCQPDKPQGRSAKLVAPPTKVWAEAHGVVCVQPTKLNDGTFEAWLREQAPDVCVLVAYGRILKQPILDVPRYGFLNMHPSLLPRHRGPSPIQTAILCGDDVTGVAVMRLDAGMDTGDILLREEYPILPEDTTASLSERLAHAGAEALVRALDLVESGTAVFIPQPTEGVTITRLYTKEDGRIRWGQSARDISNLVRAAVPWPVAHCRFRGDVCRIHRVSVINESVGTSVTPGTVIDVDRCRVHVATGKGQIAIDVFQAPGKKTMPIADFLRGQPITPGERFEDL